MNVAVLGGSGFVGRHLGDTLRARGDTVVALSLRDPLAAAEHAASCDAIVNLAGEPIAQRWSASAKRRILDSRVELPRRFLDALSQAPRRPATYVSASAIGYYGTSETATLVESSPPGDDFLARACVAWEREALRARDLGMRVAIVRSGVVLGREGGMLAKLLPIFRAGAGGIVGTGRQWVSWVHVEDLAGIYALALDRGDGPFNATAPAPVTNAEFVHALGEILHRPAALRVPALAVRALLGQGADFVLTGQRVLPERTLASGYAFAFPELKPALERLL